MASASRTTAMPHATPSAAVAAAKPVVPITRTNGTASSG